MERHKFHPEKLKDAIRFIVNSCEPENLGQVKLHKVLYYSDMLSYLASGQPITGARYKKRRFGPTCEPLVQTLAELERENEIEIQTVDFFGYNKKQFVQKFRKNHSTLNNKEIQAITEVVRFVCVSNTASTISDLSHDIVWDSVEMGQDIPYYMAIHWLPTGEEEEALEWSKEVVAEIADAGRHGGTEVGRGARPSLRERMATRS